MRLVKSTICNKLTLRVSEKTGLFQFLYLITSSIAKYIKEYLHLCIYKYLGPIWQQQYLLNHGKLTPVSKLNLEM